MSTMKAIVAGLVLLVGLGWFVLKDGNFDGVAKLFGGGGSETKDTNSDLPPVERSGDEIRIASFNIQVFGDSKSNKPHVMNRLAEICREFDIVAIQEIRSKNQDILPNFVELINESGRNYDYVIGPRIGRTVSKEQYAFVFDTASVVVDRNQIYTVEDPDDLLHREPLVAPFRVRGLGGNEAFTFKLVNIHTDPDETDQELDALGDVYTAVARDGSNEDDIIVLGDLNVDDKHLGRLGQISGITPVISGKMTNTRKTKQYDNIVFVGAPATAEFTGRGGVYDFMRKFNLTEQEALEISDHLPVWAEFKIYEGGQPGRVATRPIPSGR
jgi:deoxyribonuclease-1-like protein